MKLPEKGVLLRIFAGETDKHGSMSLYEQIVLKARELNLAGATVLRGIMGFGAHSRMHSAKILRLSEEMSIIIEIVDQQDKIDLLNPTLPSQFAKFYVNSMLLTPMGHYGF